MTKRKPDRKSSRTSNAHPTLFPNWPEQLPGIFEELQLKQLSHPIWTEHKAKLVERYLYYFVLVTHHGIYLDGFAGPQEPSKPDTWAARLVVKSKPMFLTKFFFCERSRSGVKA